MIKDLRFEDYFLFTQHSLATFDKCPLKFSKRYLENLKWDSFPDEDIKRRLEMGNDFHLLAYRYFLGIDTGLTDDMEGSIELKSWLEALTSNFKRMKERIYLPEYKIRMVKGILRLEANFDLLVLDNDKIEIWDWKTHGKNQSGKVRNEKFEADRLKKSLQTIVYMFVLKEQCERIFGRNIKSENIRMCYWQPDPAKVLCEIRYSDEMHKRYREILEKRINDILGFDYKTFDKALYEKHCKYCEFNWFCNNERVDFNLMKEDEDFLDELDWDSIKELT
jgi:hypothetical protein